MVESFSRALALVFLSSTPAFAQTTHVPAPARIGISATSHNPSPSVIFVDDSAAGANTGTSWQNAFVDLQSALAVAGASSRIWVAEGTYTPSDTDATASFVLSSGVKLYGGFAGWETLRDQRDWELHPTVLSGDIGRDDVVGSGTFWYSSWNIHTANAGHVIVANDVSSSTIVDGFVIADGSTGPTGTGAGDPLMYGSGIYALNGSPTVRNCTFTHNLAAWALGAGIYVLDGSPRIERCRFVENYVHSGNGAGIGVYGTGAPTVLDCEFVRNQCVATDSSGAQGGGLYYEGPNEARVERCIFDGNVCRAFYSIGNSVGYGGGISTWGPMVVRDCTFTRNQAHVGGGMIAWVSATVIQGRFYDNLAVPQPNDPNPELGGIGAGAVAFSFAPMNLTLENCTVARNRGKKSVGLATLAAGGHLVIENSIVWGNIGTAPEVIGYWPEQVHGSFSAAYSCITKIFDAPEPGEDPIDPGNLPGCIQLDPSFVSPLTGDLHVSASSPCADAGDNQRVPFGVLLDLDGEPRFVDDLLAPNVGHGTPPLVDMGAYERP